MRWILIFLLALAFAWLELFVGGTRLAYCMPGLCVIALAGALAALVFRKCSWQASLAGVLSTLVFGGYVLARNRLSEVEYVGRLQFFIMAGCLVMYLLFATVLTRPAERKIFFYILMAFALAQVLVGIGQFMERNQWMPLPWAQRRDDNWRASGLFISPNNYAGYLEVIALMAISFTIWARGKIVSRLLMAYVAVACVVGLAISGSRGGYLGIAAGVLALLFFSVIALARLKRTQFLPITLAAVAGVVVLFGGATMIAMKNPQIANRLMTINDTENMRLLLWESAIQQWEISPVTGTGGSSFLYYGRRFRDPSVQNDPIHVHNDYIQLLAEYGVIGAGLFGVFLFVHLGLGVRTMRRSVKYLEEIGETNGDSLALAIGGMSALVAYMVHAVVEFNLQIPVDAYMMAAIFGILANGERPLTKSEKPPISSKLATGFGRLALPVGSIALLIYAVPMIMPEYFTERARIALRDGDFEQGIAFAKQGIEKTQDNPDLFFYVGESARSLACQTPERMAELLPFAVENLTNSLGIFPYDTKTALRLAQTYSNAGDYGRASQTMDYAELLDPNSSLVYIYRGYIELGAGYPEDAIEAFEQAQELGVPPGKESGHLVADGLRRAKAVQEIMEKRDANLEKAFSNLENLMPPSTENAAEEDAETEDTAPMPEDKK